jgi:hypothetical protein
VPSPHVTRAVGSTTAVGTARPLTCGQPRQTGRRSAMSGIGSVSAGFVGTGTPAAPTSDIGGVSGAANRLGSGRASPIIVATAVSGWRVRSHQDVRSEGRGRCVGVPRRRGCAGGRGAGQGGRPSPTQLCWPEKSAVARGEQCVLVYRWQPRHQYVIRPINVSAEIGERHLGHSLPCRPYTAKLRSKLPIAPLVPR